MKISRDDKNAAKDFLKKQVSKINLNSLAPDVKKAVGHILGQFEKWYLDYAPVKAIQSPQKTAAAKKRVAKKKTTTKRK